MKKNRLFFEGVADYVEWLRLCALSDRTVATYKAGLEAFSGYLSGVGKDPMKLRWGEFGPDLVRSFLKALVDSGQSMGTRNSRLNAIKSFVKYSADRDLELISVWSKISQIKSKKVAVEKERWLSKEQVSLLLKQAGGSRIGIRDHCILHFLLSTGLRLEEMVSLRVSSLHFGSEPYVLVHGKGGRKRLVPLPEEITEELKRYIARFHCESDAPLFYCKAHSVITPMSHDNVQRIVDKYADMARKEDLTFPKISPHVLRHTYAALLYRSGLSLTELSLLLGHSSPETTEIYAETDVKMIEAAMEKLHGSDKERVYSSLTKEERDRLKSLSASADIPTSGKTRLDKISSFP